MKKHIAIVFFIFVCLFAVAGNGSDKQVTKNPSKSTIDSLKMVIDSLVQTEKLKAPLPKVVTERYLNKMTPFETPFVFANTLNDGLGKVYSVSIDYEILKKIQGCNTDDGWAVTDEYVIVTGIKSGLTKEFQLFKRSDPNFQINWDPEIQTNYAGAFNFQWYAPVGDIYSIELYLNTACLNKKSGKEITETTVYKSINCTISEVQEAKKLPEGK
jgi:hypothetical protein